MNQQTLNTQANAKVVAVSGSLLGVATAFTSSGLLLRPNRIFDGESLSLFSVTGVWGWLLIGLWLCAIIITLAPTLSVQLRGGVVGLIGALAPALTLWSAGNVAQAYTLANGPVARISLGASLWISLLGAYIVMYAASAWISSKRMRLLLFALPIGLIAVLLASGHLSDLSILREYANNQAEFGAQLRLHLFYTLGATAGGIVLGIPLGILANSKRRFEGPVFGVLNVLNVLPVLAFIGLLNPVLTLISASFPFLEALNIRPVGWAPVVIVLTFYATYPIARNTQTALQSLDQSVIDAACGIGMGFWQRVTAVDLPLAAPVIIAGIRIALVQTTAGAIIAGLVGGGGLGSFVFLGASQTAIDLVLLGTIPIVLLGLTIDRIVYFLQELFTYRSATS